MSRPVSIRNSLILLLGLLAGPLRAAEVRREPSPLERATTYSVNQDGCELRWILRRHAELPGFGISERSRCGLDAAGQIPLRADLLRAVLADTGQLAGWRDFEWGRLLRGDANDVYGSRLARAAARSPRWDKSKGRLFRNPQEINRFVADLLNREAVFPELVAVFAGANLELKVSGVEKVLVGTERQAGIATGLGQAKLPFDCIVYFTVTRKTAVPGR